MFTWAFCCRMSVLLRPPPVEVTVHFQAPSTRPGSYMNEMWPLCLNTRLSASRTLRCWNIAQYDPYLILFFPQGTLLFLGLATRCQSLMDVAPTCSVCLFQRGYVRLKKAPRSVILPVLRVFCSLPDGHGNPCHDKVLQPTGHVLRHLRLQQVPLRFQVPLVPTQHLFRPQEKSRLCFESGRSVKFEPFHCFTIRKETFPSHY